MNWFLGNGGRALVVSYEVPMRTPATIKMPSWSATLLSGVFRRWSAGKSRAAPTSRLAACPVWQDAFQVFCV